MAAVGRAGAGFLGAGLEKYSQEGELVLTVGSRTLAKYSGCEQLERLLEALSARKLASSSVSGEARFLLS